MLYVRKNNSKGHGKHSVGVYRGEIKWVGLMMGCTVFLEGKR